MRTKEKPEPLGQRGRAKQRNAKFFNQLNFTTKKYYESNFEQRVKSWAVDRMAEYYFQGQNSPQHRLAVTFWKKSGRRLKHA